MLSLGFGVYRYTGGSPVARWSIHTHISLLLERVTRSLLVRAQPIVSHSRPMVRAVLGKARNLTTHR
jgi:hypothetical protein